LLKIEILVMEKQKTGKIAQIIGPVVDVSFEEEGNLPNIYDALEVRNNEGHAVVLECQYDIGENTVRTIAMDSTDGLRRGMEVISKGQPITMPTGDEVRGRLFNVIGEAIDGLGRGSRRTARGRSRSRSSAGVAGS
jgi:F-type H+-transporting ATPase subunit beta